MEMFRQGPLGEVEKPYDPPPTEGAVCRVQMARSAEAWRADIEAMLVEYGMPVACTDTVIQMVDKLGYSIRSAIEALRPLLYE